jgi:4-hydroxythreonine-4-phosphate dehydrogenase
LKKIAISVGDLNGVGIEIALHAHDEIIKFCSPIYCINETMLNRASKLLSFKPKNEMQLSHVEGAFQIQSGVIDAQSGLYSYCSFLKAIELTNSKKTDALVTLPIHKEAWSRAGIKYKGHTDMLRFYFKKDAIMMLGCEELYVPLYTEHIPLKDVASTIDEDRLTTFFINLHKSIGDKKVGVLALNPHAGDGGVLGSEESIIKKAIENANSTLDNELFFGPLVPDTAFTPHARKNFKYICAMYHDQGLAPLKALYFDESINVSLNLPIIRTSVDHGTAFDIAYQNKASLTSYINAIKAAISLNAK